MDNRACPRCGSKKLRQMGRLWACLAKGCHWSGSDPKMYSR